MRYALQGVAPRIHEDAFVADEATLIGDAVVMAGASVWFGAVLRADNDAIRVGPGSNVQDGVVIHTDPGYPVEIGESVTVGHRAVLHGCAIGDYSLVGINSVVLNGARVGRYCLIGAHAMVTENKEIPDRSLVIGSPGRVARELSDEECRTLEEAARVYRRKIPRYRAHARRVDD